MNMSMKKIATSKRYRCVNGVYHLIRGVQATSQTSEPPPRPVQLGSDRPYELQRNHTTMNNIERKAATRGYLIMGTDTFGDYAVAAKRGPWVIYSGRTERDIFGPYKWRWVALFQLWVFDTFR